MIRISLKKIIENEERQEKHKERWLTKFHNLTSEQRLEFAKKCYDKYSSDKYVDKEYNAGFFPRTTLYYWLYDYGEKYGRPVEEKELNGYFPEDGYIIDNNFYVTIMNGQGSVARIKFL